MTLMVPRLVLKPVYDSLSKEQEAHVRRQLALVERLDVGEGLALYQLAREARDFDAFYARVHAPSADIAAFERRLDAAGRLGDSMIGDGGWWDDDQNPVPTE